MVVFGLTIILLPGALAESQCQCRVLRDYELDTRSSPFRYFLSVSPPPHLASAVASWIPLVMPNLILRSQSVLSFHSFFHFEIHSDDKGYPENIVNYIQMSLTRLTLFDP